MYLLEMKCDAEAVVTSLPTSSIYLSKNAGTVPNTLGLALETLCSMHNDDFRCRIDEHEFACRGSLVQCVEFFPSDPLYNVRWEQDDEVSAHYLFAYGDVNVMEKLYREVLRPGAHDQMFRYSLQVGT